MKVLSSTLKRAVRPVCRQYQPTPQKARNFVFNNGEKKSGRKSIPIPPSTLSIPVRKPHAPTVDLCPSPSCASRATPKDLDIDRASSLDGSMPLYHEHIIVSTGDTSWPSRIEYSSDLNGRFINDLRIQFRPPGRRSTPGEGGQFYNVCV
jgi:hypothetical protein